MSNEVHHSCSFLNSVRALLSIITVHIGEECNQIVYYLRKTFPNTITQVEV